MDALQSLFDLSQTGKWPVNSYLPLSNVVTISEVVLFLSLLIWWTSGKTNNVSKAYDSYHA
jgi:hypothetical protein